jgi:hypothetical protein
MKRESQCACDKKREARKVSITRRTALGAAAVGLLGPLSGSVLAAQRDRNRDPNKEAEGRAAGAALAERMRRRVEESQAFGERMLNATPEERLELIRERTLARHRRAVDDLKGRLGCSDTEWQVIRPRLEMVYNLLHPLPPTRGDDSSGNEVNQKMQELRQALDDKGTPVDELKAKLTALRAAKENAKRKLASAQQSLRRVMTVRQEAILVLEGLLD